MPDAIFVRRNTRKENGDHRFSNWQDLLEFIRYPAYNDPNRPDGSRYLVDPETVNDTTPCPEALYYALDNYEYFWILAFDIDAKDVALERVSGEVDVTHDEATTIFKQAGVYEAAPKPAQSPDQQKTEKYPYTFEDIQQSLRYAFELKEWLTDVVGFPDVRVFYTGQGAHIYARGGGARLDLTQQSRRFLATYASQSLGIPIDEQVTSDPSRVMRMPHSLHSDVCRRVIEVQSPETDFISKARPEIISD